MTIYSPPEDAPWQLCAEAWLLVLQLSAGSFVHSLRMVFTVLLQLLSSDTMCGTAHTAVCHDALLQFRLPDVQMLTHLRL